MKAAPVLLSLLVAASLLLGFLYVRRELGGVGEGGVGTTTTPPGRGGKIWFGGWIRSVSYGNIYQASIERVESEMRVLDDLGVQFYSIHPSYDVFIRSDAERIELLDYVFERAEAKGKLVQIADSAAETWRRERLSIEEFRRRFLERSTIYMERWRPWAYEVLHEPNGWMEEFTTEDLSPEQWADIAKAVTANVKKINPSTITLHAFIVSTEAPLWRGEVETMRLTLDDPNLDAVGFDIYGRRGQDHKTPLIEPYLSTIKEAGKKLWIPETWGRGGALVKAAGEDPVVDVAWVKHIVQWAVKNEVEGVVWFFTMLFGSPGSYTETFHGIKTVMEEQS